MEDAIKKKINIIVEDDKIKNSQSKNIKGDNMKKKKKKIFKIHFQK